MIYLLFFVSMFVVSGAIAITMFVKDERAVKREKSHRSNSWTNSRTEIALYVGVAILGILAVIAVIIMLKLTPLVD